AEDGYQLWLRYDLIDGPTGQQYREHATALVVAGSSSTLTVAHEELQRGLGAMLGRPLALSNELRDGAIVIGTPASSPLIARLNLPLGADDGFVIRSAAVAGHRVTLIAGSHDIGVLYG